MLTSLTVSAESVRQSTSMMARSSSPSLFTRLLYPGAGRQCQMACLLPL
jgi:hypothetical protein